MSERFFSPQPIQTDRVRLVGAEAHHLLHVMRAKVGAQVVLFDGSGWEFEAQLLQARRHEAELRICARKYVDRELPVCLVLGVAMPKGDRQKWLVEKAVELGVSVLVPLVVSRSVAQPGPGMLDRLRRTVIEASKQCGRNLLMEIRPPMDWAEWVSAYQKCSLRWVADPGGQAPWAESPSDCSWVPERPEAGSPQGRGAASGGDLGEAVGGPMPCSEGQLRLPADPAAVSPSVSPAPFPKPLWAAAVGPEGGWTPEELAIAQAGGWHLVSLGPRILRTETAAVVVAALLGAWASSRNRLPGKSS